jgi:hypothetical protein
MGIPHQADANILEPLSIYINRSTVVSYVSGYGRGNQRGDILNLIRQNIYQHS